MSGKTKDRSLLARALRAAINKHVLIALCILLQIAAIVYAVVFRGIYSYVFLAICELAGFIVSVHIIVKRGKSAYKFVWLFTVITLPIFGTLFYIIFYRQATSKRFSRKVDSSEFFMREDGLSLLKGDLDKALKRFPEYGAKMRYLENDAGFPVYAETSAEYLKSGELFYVRLLEELEKAEKYIFLEFFIIREGEMWQGIYEILKRKAKDGVLVKVLYDDIGCLKGLPERFVEELKKHGIECTVFNAFKPFLISVQNNRDHRKIVSIDGKTAFTGGINVADEYINKLNRFGHWKDAGVMLKGKAAWSLTAMFLQNYELASKTRSDYAAAFPYSGDIPEDRAKEAKTQGIKEENGTEREEYFQPYTDSPTDGEEVGEHVYLQTVYAARKYIYITTPYLIIDGRMADALTLAAKSGADVRIITPGHGDKKFVHNVTRSYYKELIDGGVKVYEYSKGFIHSKTFVTDDATAVVGTTNLDYRSLYLHFECGVAVYGKDFAKAVKEDFEEILPSCKEITAQDCKENIFKRIYTAFLRLFAPLM